MENPLGRVGPFKNWVIWRGEGVPRGNNPEKEGGGDVEMGGGGCHFFITLQFNWNYIVCVCACVRASVCVGVGGGGQVKFP